MGNLARALGMNRRTFLASLFGAASAMPALALPNSHDPKFSIKQDSVALPTADQLAWQNLEVGMFVHFAPNTWQNDEQDNLSTPLSEINPKNLNTDQWAEIAVDLGAKYLVYVAKHSGGFCMWQTTTTDYSIANTPWRNGKGDVLADVSASCRKAGLKLGVYVSPRDKKFGAEIGGRCKNQESQRTYNAIYRQQLTEVLSRYGEMVEIWFDGSSVIPVGDILERFAPHAMIFQGPHATIRWAGNEDGFVPYPTWNAVSSADAISGVSTAINGDPNGSVWLPIEADVSIRRPDWFWSITNERNLLSLDSLMEIYYRSVGRGAQLLLNIPPDRTGLIPQADRARARQFGAEIRRRFGKSVAEASGTGTILELPLPGTTRIDTIMLQEDCSNGQHIESYTLQARVGKNWVSMGTGSSIGHKRIQPIDPIHADAVRIIVTHNIGRPAILHFAAFDIGETPPKDWNSPATAWAYNEAGTWENYKFNVDISNKIAAAAQYRLRFVPQSISADCAPKVHDSKLVIGGVPQPKFIRVLTDSPNTLVVTVPSIGQRVVVAGEVSCAANGTILLQKVSG